MFFTKPIVKSISTFLAVSLAFEPLLLAKQKEKVSFYDSVKNYAEFSGLNKKGITASEWYNKVKHGFDPENRMKFDYLIKKNPNLKAPTILITKGKSTDEKQVVNISITDGKFSLKYSLVKELDKVYAQDSLGKYTFHDLFFSNLVNNLTGFNFPIMSNNKLLSLSQAYPKSAAKYQEAYRNYLISLEQHQRYLIPGLNELILKAEKKGKYSWLLNVLETPSQADSYNGKCLNGGNPGTYTSSTGKCEPDDLNRYCKIGDTSKIKCADIFSTKDYCANTNPPNLTSESECASHSEDVSEIIKSKINQFKSDTSKSDAEAENSFKVWLSNTTISIFDTCYGKESTSKLAKFTSQPDSFKSVDYRDFTNFTRVDPKECPDTEGKEGDCATHNRRACSAAIERLSKLQQASKQLSPDTNLPGIVTTQCTDTEGFAKEHPNECRKAFDKYLNTKDGSFDNRLCNNKNYSEIIYPDKCKSATADNGTTQTTGAIKHETKEKCDDLWYCTTNGWAVGGALATVFGGGLLAGYLIWDKDEKQNINNYKTVNNKTINNKKIIIKPWPLQTSCTGANEEACSFRIPGTGGLSGETSSQQNQ